MAEAGSPAPDASFTSPDGTPRTISDFRGKKLVVYFYPKDATSGCTREAQDFTALIGEFAAAGATVLGISKDSEKSHAKFIAKYELKVELGTDADGSLCEAFGVWVEKSLYGRKYMGIERATFLIDAGGIVAKVWRKVKVAGHAATVLEAVKALS
ncbi:MAG: peroxiredoxin [Sphingomonadales bacterium]|jgi:peroxiredoxin Q/BCP|nr:peroxiredoxin [Sphingomonadales bacterium]